MERKMDFCDIGTANIAYRIFGPPPVSVIIEGAINSCNAEWWEFCPELNDHSVLVYDRAGYGESSVSALPRTPENIVREFSTLLRNLNIENDFVLVGHSQGGLYATLFSLLYPEKVKAFILLDPLSYRDNDFRALLSEKEFNASGVDKSKTFQFGRILTRLHLGFLFKAQLKRYPPFCYHTFTADVEDYILKSLMQPKQYSTALEEYRFSHDEAQLAHFKKLAPQVSTKFTLITHSSATLIEEYVSSWGVDNELAEKVENIWQKLMEAMLTFSKNSEKLIAPNSGHYMHLTDREIVLSEIRKNLLTTIST
jgi:pimeloyl-ACP methyl ester carboxylesterase